MDCYVVVDCGTSNCRAAMVTENGQIINIVRKPIRIECPQPAFAEVDTDHIWRQVCSALAALLDKDPGCRIAAVGVSSMLGYVPLDRNDQPLMPAIIWMDNRARKQTGQILERIPGDTIYRKTGRRASPELLAPRLLWLAQHRPDIHRRIDRVIGLKDDIIRRLTGTIATDPAHLDYSLLYNIAEKQLDEELLTALNIDPAIFPTGYRADHVIGKITPAAAGKTGLTAGIPVAAGSSDGTTAMYGGGVLGKNTGVLVAGTTDVLMAANSEPVDDAHQVLSVNTAMVDGRYLAGGAMGMSGGTLAHFEKLFGIDLKQKEEEIGRLSPGCGGVLALPGISGERAPYWLENSFGGLIGLRRDHGPGHILRALMEGTAYRTARLLRIMADSGLEPECIRVVGGTAASDVWNQIRADVWGLPVERPEAGEATLLGTAMFCRSALDSKTSLEEIARQWIKIEQRYSPDPAAYTKYRKLSKLFDEIMLKNAEFCDALSDLV